MVSRSCPFYVNLPLGVVALAFIVAFFHLPHERSKHSIDYAGFATLGAGLTFALLATSLGGVQYAWGSWQTISLYTAGAISLVLFVLNERRAKEPFIPLKLFANPVFSLSAFASED